MKIKIIIFFCVISNFVSSQNKVFSLEGNISEEGTSLKVEGAIIKIANNEKKEYTYFSVSDSLGNYKINNIEPGNYIIDIKAPFDNAGIEDIIGIYEDLIYNKSIIINPTVLSGVQVVGRKKLIKIDGDKIQVDVESLPGYEADNSMEVLNKVPGVWLDGESIRINGSDQINILINGKQQTLTQSQIFTMLKNIPARNIEKVEIISGGSAKYDATGGSVLNIVTKKNFFDGYNLTFTNDILINDFIGNFNSIFATIQKNKFQIQFSYSFQNTNRYIDEVGTSAYTDQNTNLKYINDYNFNTKMNSIMSSVSYEINKKNNLQLSLNSTFGNSRNNLEEDSKFEGENSFDLKLINRTLNKENLNSLNFEYQIKLDTLGKNIKLNYGYLNGSLVNNMDISNEYQYPDSSTESNFSIAKIPLKGFQNRVSIDLEYPFKKNNFEAGLKFTSGQIENFVSYSDIINGESVFNYISSDSLKYDEKVFAGYSIFTKILNKYTIKAGLRVEHTKYESLNVSNNSSFNNDYTNLLPNLAVSYKNDGFSMALKLTSGLNRPDYNYLNPYQFYINDFRYRIGNGNLKPQTRYTLSLESSPFDFLFVSLGYNRINDMIFVVNKQIENSLVTFQSPENTLSLDDYFINISVFYTLFDNKLSGQINAYGEIFKYNIKEEFITSASDLETSYFSYYSWNNNYKISNKLSLSSSLNIRSNANFYQIEQSSRWRLDLGVNYSLKKDVFNIYARVNDVFNTYNMENTSYFNEFQNSYTRDLNLLLFKFGFTYSLDRGWKNDRKKVETDTEAIERFKN